ncbi:MAG: hypothetical protein V7L21_23880 [Nostoc sp.]|uniref:hypothetical protein n=1 Tax=unclassified Nostoc TaxID=2593658 RepID=UPI0025FF3466|nr:hypothetical protein [Nostoc sp. NMS9]MBN3941544.1 hypothetical protein [Nostoc sp. NMS9]
MKLQKLHWEQEAIAIISSAVKHKSIAIAASQSQTLTIHSTLLRSQSHITSNLLDLIQQRLTLRFISPVSSV